MVTALVALCALAPVEGIADYFPLNPGDQWIYTEESDAITAITMDTVGEMVEIEGKQSYPVITSRDDKELDRVYYRVLEGTVEIVAFDKAKPLLAPYAVLKSPDLATKWSYKGETYMQGSPADLKMEGRVKRAGTVEFEGRKLDALQVTLEATILEEFGTKVTVTQVATYGKGVGLIKMESTSKLPKKTVKSVRRLTAYKPIKP
jgi:hypothetical protein